MYEFGYHGVLRGVPALSHWSGWHHIATKDSFDKIDEFVSPSEPSLVIWFCTISATVSLELTIGSSRSKVFNVDISCRINANWVFENGLSKISNSCSVSIESCWVEKNLSHLLSSSFMRSCQTRPFLRGSWNALGNSWPMAWKCRTVIIFQTSVLEFLIGKVNVTH